MSAFTTCYFDLQIMTVQLIVTHPGSAHKDDFLACSLLAHLHGVPIQRRDPTAEDLADPTICVVDVARSHSSQRQISKPPETWVATTCTT